MIQRIPTLMSFSDYVILTLYWKTRCILKKVTLPEDPALHARSFSVRETKNFSVRETKNFSVRETKNINAPLGSLDTSVYFDVFAVSFTTT